MGGGGGSQGVSVSRKPALPPPGGFGVSPASRKVAPRLSRGGGVQGGEEGQPFSPVLLCACGAWWGAVGCRLSRQSFLWVVLPLLVGLLRARAPLGLFSRFAFGSAELTHNRTKLEIP